MKPVLEEYIGLHKTTNVELRSPVGVVEYVISATWDSVEKAIWSSRTVEVLWCCSLG